MVILLAEMSPEYVRKALLRCPLFRSQDAPYQPGLKRSNLTEIATPVPVDIDPTSALLCQSLANPSDVERLVGFGRLCQMSTVHDSATTMCQNLTNVSNIKEFVKY